MMAVKRCLLIDELQRLLFKGMHFSFSWIFLIFILDKNFYFLKGYFLCGVLVHFIIERQLDESIHLL